MLAFSKKRIRYLLRLYSLEWCNSYPISQLNLQCVADLVGDEIGNPASLNHDVAIAGADLETTLHVWHLLGQGVFNFALVHAATPSWWWACPGVTRPGRVVGTPAFMPRATAMLWLMPRRQRLRPAKISNTRLVLKLFSRHHWLTLMPWYCSQDLASAAVRSLFIEWCG